MLRSLFVPTPDIQNYPSYYLVQLLAQERIRSLVTGDSFVDISEQLVIDHLEIPKHLEDPAEVKDYVNNQSKVVFEAFKLFEKDAHYQTALHSLVPYKGYPFEVQSVSLTGITILMDVSEKPA